MLTEGALATDEFAALLGSISPNDMAKLGRMAQAAPWREVPGRAYETAEVVDFWEPCQRAFFLSIPPGGNIPRHHDVFIPGSTHHLVLATNAGCLNGWVDTQGQERVMHLMEGHRYKVERGPLHWAVNRGNTPRIHLLVEFAP